MNRIIVVFVLVCLLASPIAQGRCLQEAASERLTVLRVDSCLWRASSKGRVVTELRETLTNVSDKEIILELHRAPILRFGVFVALGGDTVSRIPSPPVMHGPDPLWSAGYESIPLAAGDSISLSAAMSEFLAQAPVPKADYTVGVTHGYSWRYRGEPEGQAFRLRQLEGNQKRSFPKTIWFEGVRLK